MLNGFWGFGSVSWKAWVWLYVKDHCWNVYFGLAAVFCSVIRRRQFVALTLSDHFLHTFNAMNFLAQFTGRQNLRAPDDWIATLEIFFLSWGRSCFLQCPPQKAFNTNDITHICRKRKWHLPNLQITVVFLSALAATWLLVTLMKAICF